MEFFLRAVDAPLIRLAFTCRLHRVFKIRGVGLLFVGWSAPRFYFASRSVKYRINSPRS
jgi:hypothetical protein